MSSGVKLSSSSDSCPVQEKILLEPYSYILQVPGKQVREKLIQAFNFWLKIPEDKLNVIADVVKMLHNSSLLIDDIEDSSKLRRGIPVAHQIYGVAHTINSANYMYFKALEKVLSLSRPQCITIFTEELLELHRGQGMDIYWRDSYTCPTEDEYREMVKRKTGGLFRLAVKLMQSFSENRSFLDETGSTVGISLNSFRAVRVKDILKQRTTDIDIKKYFVDYLEQIGSFAYTKVVLKELEEKSQELIADLGGNPHLSAVVVQLAKLYS
ncbi:hypothetical protein ACROYT_G030139 [Oculina patagonica]